jgi:hypothetical protein
LRGNIQALWSSPSADDGQMIEDASTPSISADVTAGTAARAVTAGLGNEVETAGPPELPPNGRTQGLVFDGLVPAATDGPCPGGFEIEVDGETLCTHGPDAGPPGLDVRTPRTIADLTLQTLALPSQANPIAGDNAPVEGGIHVHADGSEHDHGIAGGTDGSGTATETGIVPLIGDGTDGNRVQVVYAVATDRTDRYDEIAPLIANWAAHMDAMVNQSAARTGGERHIRFVTDAAGNLSVAKVVLAPTEDDSFGNTITALKNAGYDSPSRKYLILTDASLYCGIATIYGDDKPTQDNYNNGRFAQYSRVDSSCWGFATSVELHEIVHNMGGVQQSAPHVTSGWHCTDEYDRMCYRDSSDVQMTYLCESGMENLLDCGNDDYFHTAPPAGSYLDTHWNVADSSFLHAGPVDGNPPPPPPPPPANEAPLVTVDGSVTVALPDAATLEGSVADDGLPGPYTVTWSASGPGAVTFADPDAEVTTATFSVAGVYELQLTADDGELSGSATHAVTVEDAPSPDPITTVTETFSGSLNKKFTRRSYEVFVGDGPLDAVLSFDEKPKGNKKGATENQMSLTLVDGDGNVIVSASGGTPVELSVEVSAPGSYSFEVSGSQISFDLDVMHAPL